MLFLLFLFTVIAERYAPLRKRPLLFKFPYIIGVTYCRINPYYKVQNLSIPRISACKVRTKFPKHIWRGITLYVNDVTAGYNNKCQTCKTGVASE